MSETVVDDTIEAAKPDPLGAGRAKLFVKTFGCQVNEWDSIKVSQLLAQGYVTCDDESEADLVFVNTCSVREKGEHKLRSYLGRLREIKADRPGMIIGVGGCVAQQDGRQLANKHRDVNFVVGTHNLSLVPSLVRNAKRGFEPQVAVDFREEWEDFTEADISSADPNNQLVGESPVRALVAIQRGCNKRCSYCVVPTTRGPEVSRSPVEVLREVKFATSRGASEVLLLGQTVNSYGKDLSPRYPFERLIADIAAIDAVKRIRFISPHPAEVKEAFIDLYTSSPKLCPHIHLPLQSGSNRILKLMNRNYRRERYLEIVGELKSRVPGITITTDIIVGFPTETDSDFEESLEMLRLVDYLAMYSFVYSQRPNTEALTAFSAAEEVPVEVAKERLAQLMKLQRENSLRHHRALVGERVQVLAENPRFGRTASNIAVEIHREAVKMGDMVDLSIFHGSPQGVKGE